MLNALVLAFGQLSDPRTRKVVWLSIAAALATFALLATLIWWALSQTTLTDYSWVDWVIDLLGGLAVMVLAWILFPATVGTVSSFFLDEVVQRAEDRHYPDLPPARSGTLTEELGVALRFLALVIAVNIAALPLYLLLPGINLVIFYTVNGYLLGREYFEMVAARRMDRREAALLRKSRPLKPFLAGVVIAFLSTVPIVNLLVPVIASAFMVHIYHSMAGNRKAMGWGVNNR